MKKFYFVIFAILISSCSDKYLVINYNSPLTERKVNLMVKNSDAVEVAANSIDNMQMLMFDSNGKCLRVLSYNSVVFDENYIFATTITIPKATTSVTVLANAIGYTFPSQQMFVGATLAEIFISSAHAHNLSSNYFQEPKSFFEGTAPVMETESETEVIKVSVDISRVVSKIVINIADGLSFSDNSGMGFSPINSPQRIYIDGIDSIFMVDTPAGINLDLTAYMGDLIGFDKCQIYKVADFESSANSLLSDEITVLPQIKASTSKLPFMILSVTGTKAGQQIGKGNPLYYGMRLKDVKHITGGPIAVESLPRNVVIVVTINNFSGVGSTQHPNPNYLNTLDVSVDVKSWADYYSVFGNAE